MSTAEAVTFLQRKLTLIVQSTWDPDERSALNQSWTKIFAGIAPQTTLSALQKLDRALEKIMQRTVYDWDIPEIQRKLIEELGKSRLTKAEIARAEAPAPSPDEVLLNPSGKRRPETRRFVDFNGIEQVIVDIWAPTLREFGQIYADYSGQRVRLHPSLAQRQIPAELRPQIGEAAASEVLAALRCHCATLHVLALKEPAGIVFKDTTEEDARQAKGDQPIEATAEEIHRASVAISLDRFWEMVEIARGKKGDAAWTIAKLEAALKRCSRIEILGFQLRLEECLNASYRLELWGVAYLVKGGCSDDRFESFRGWLIAQGRGYFEAALLDPERAADQGEADEMEGEALFQIARAAYAGRSRKPMPVGLTVHPSSPTGKDWTEAELPTLFPRLAKKLGVG